LKKLLIIAYYFPPSGGPGVQRVLKHIKYLPEFGWQPVVLTVSNGQFPARDESLLAQIPDSTIVYRTAIYEPYQFYRILTGKKPGTAIDVNVIKKESQKIGFKEKIAEFIRGTFFIPDARIGWLLSAGKGLEKIFKEHDIDAIYSSSPPYTCSLIARKAKRKSNLPWVAGFRDPWTKFLTTPKRWLIPGAIDRHLEHAVFKEADAVESAWEGITKDALGKYPDLNENKFHHISNGFDSSDFPKVEFKRNEKFTITYTGSLYGRRNPSALFSAIDILIDKKILSPGEILLRFVGRFGAEVEEMFRNSRFGNSIETISYVPHHESIKYLMLSDVLLLIVDEAKESEEIVPGKVYEYIGTKRPIIAIAPQESAIAKLMNETGSGKVAHQTEVDKIADIVLDYYNQWKNDKWNFSPKIDIVNSYERREAARKLADILNTLT
jgi:hypothetical protein